MQTTEISQTNNAYCKRTYILKNFCNHMPDDSSLNQNM